MTRSLSLVGYLARAAKVVATVAARAPISASGVPERNRRRLIFGVRRLSNAMSASSFRARWLFRKSSKGPPMRERVKTEALTDNFSQLDSGL